MIPATLTAIRQPTEQTCGQAVVAMLTGQPVDEVIERLGGSQLTDRDLAVALAADGIACQKGEPLWSGLQVVVVAAVRRQHYIIVDDRNPVRGTQIFDPDRSAYWEKNADYLASSGAIAYAIAIFDRWTPLAATLQTAVES